MQALSNLERVDEDFVCPVCLNLLVDPVVGACGHDICLHCYRRWVVEEERRTCPVCREPVSATVPGICMRLRDLIQRLYPQQEQERRREVEAQEQQQRADKEKQRADTSRQRQQRQEEVERLWQDQRAEEEKLRQLEREVAALEQRWADVERLQHQRRQRWLSESGEPVRLSASPAVLGGGSSDVGNGHGAAALRSSFQSAGDALLALLRWVGRHGHNAEEQPNASPLPSFPSTALHGKDFSQLSSLLPLLALQGTLQPQQPTALPVWELGPPLESLTFNPGWAEVTAPRRHGPRAKPRLLEGKRRRSGRRA